MWVSRVWVATTLLASGGLMYAASGQRWGGACTWSGDQVTPMCGTRMDHLYDFLPPAEPWMPAGAAAQLAGASLLVLAVALLPLPWVLTRRRPGLATAGVLVATVLTEIVVGVATLSSGLNGTAVNPVAPDITVALWLLMPPLLFGYLAVMSRGWASRVAAGLLMLASPLVAAVTYAIGPWDAQPWWEAISALLTCLAAVFVLTSGIGRPVPRRLAIAEPALPI